MMSPKTSGNGLHGGTVQNGSMLGVDTRRGPLRCAPIESVTKRQHRQPPPATEHQFRLTARHVCIISATVALVASLTTLLGWFANAPRLTDWIVTDIPMFANTATASALLALALLLDALYRNSTRTVVRLLAALATSIGAATLVEHLSGINLGIDTLLVHPSYGMRAVTAIGRMGPPASTSITLLGIGILLAKAKAARRRAVPVLSIIVLAACSLSIDGYLFNADPLFAIARVTAISLQAAVIIWVLALALLVSVADLEPVRTLYEQSAAGALARRSLPFTICAPAVLGWLFILARRAEVFDRGLGMAALVLVLSAVFCGVVAWCVAGLKKHEEISRQSLLRLKRSEEELQMQRTQLQTMIENTPECVKLVARDGTILTMNTAGLTMVEADSVEAVLGQNVYDIIAPEYREKFRRMNERVCSGSKEILEFELVGFKGTRRWMETHGAPLKDAATGEWVHLGVTRDITARKHAELELERANKQLAGFLEMAAVGLHRVSKDGTILWANQAELDMLGYSAEEYIGHPITEFHADAPVINDILKRLTCGEKLYGYEARVKCKDGSIKDVVIDSSVLWENGEFIHTQCFTRDVTEFKRAQDALRDNERQLRDLIEAMPAAVYTTDAEGHITMFNRAAVEFSGRTPQIGTDSWCVTWKLYWPDGTRLPHDQCPMALALKEGRALRGYEAIAERPDGTRVNFMPFPTPLHDKDGRLVGAVNMLVDITERKKAEEASARLAAIVKSSSDAIISKDLNGIIKTWNSAAERVFGYSAEEIVGKSIITLIPPERQHEEAEILRRIRSGQMVEHFETVRQRKDGGLFDVSLTISPVRNSRGEIVGASKILRDISEQKRDARRLQQRRERLEFLSETLGDLLNASNPAAIIRDLLPKMATRLGADTYFNYMVDKDGNGLKLQAYSGIPEDVARSIERLEFGQAICGTVAQTCRPIHAEDIQNTNYDKAHLVRSFGLQSYACNPLIVGERLLGTLSFASRTRPRFDEEDLQFLKIISQYIAVALDRLKSAEDLENTVAERTASLTEAMEQMEEFSYSVSHDLRGPLRAMDSYATVLLEEYGDKFDDIARGYVSKIQRSSERMNRLTNDVLVYSRVARSQMEFESIDIERIIDDVVDQHKNLQAPAATIRIVRPLLPVLGNETSLGQCVSNILNNAVKFVAPGVKPQVTISAVRTGRLVKIRFVDNGIGIKPEHQQRVFQMFERLHPEGKYDGTGIGLTIVRKAIEKMRGKVGIESDGTNGTCFWIELEADEPRSLDKGNR